MIMMRAKFLLGIYRSSIISFLFSLLQSVIGGFFLEINFDISVGQFAVGSLDGTNAVLKEVLLCFVEADAGEGRSVESDSGSEADDGGGEQEFVEDGGVDGSQGSAVGAGQLSILLDKSGLDVSGGNDQDNLLEFLLQVSDQLLVSISVDDFISAVGHVDKDEGLIFFVGDFLDFIDDDSGGKSLVFGVNVAGSLDESLTNLGFKVGQLAVLGSLGAFEDFLDFASVGHCGGDNLLN